MPAINFATKADANYYRKVCHSSEYAAKLKVVKTTKFVETAEGEFSRVPCYCVVQK